jgi:hypothetical protein
LRPRPILVPNIPSFTDPEVKTLADKIVSGIRATNEKISAYTTKEEVSALNDKERLFLTFGIPLLAFAFGLGFARRSLDLYSDWKRK